MIAFNILLTGSTSFLGQNYLEYNSLRGANTKIFCITRKLPNSKHGALDIDHLFISKPANISIEEYIHLMERNQISAVVHSAALVGEGKGSWSDYYETNVKWTLKLANAFAKAGIKHHMFIYISSVGVLGTIPLLIPANETTPYNPDGYYHMSKVLAEKGLLDIASKGGFPLVILRPTIMYGKRDFGFLWKLLKLSRKFILPLPISTRIHLLDVRTMVRVIDSCLSNPGEPRILIVGDRDSIELRDLLTFLDDKIYGIRTIEIPNKLAQFADQFSRPLMKYANIALLCKSWYYDVSKMKSTLNMEIGQTTDQIKNYLWWYAKAC